MTQASSIPHATLKTIEVDGLSLFYREVGPADAPVVLLLHGYPASSHQFRALMPRLARYRVLAPDFPGFGFTSVPKERRYRYTFDAFSRTLEAFLQALGVTRFAMYVFDIGAPVGLRYMLRRPEQLAAIVSQNGNAYVEGLGPGWAPIQRYWQEPSAENRKALRAVTSLAAVHEMYTHGTPDPSQVAPESYTLDAVLLARPGVQEAQLDLLLDYQHNVELYPEFQRVFRERQYPALALWGEHDDFFVPAGATAFQRDLPGASVHLLNTGHFALETHLEEIAGKMTTFLSGVLD
jgi:pimeloyl-ACP methyl ester carboxylesterase